MRRLPQLQRLAVFDAVARTGGFTAAAEDLHISQPAVSRHMAALAKELGFDIFERTGRSLTLTENGRALAEAIDASFLGIERSLSEVDAQSRAFVMAIQPAIATSWIVPLLEQLETAAQAEIRLRIFERPVELEGGDWDVAIVPGLGPWPEWESTMLFQEVVRPFASPTLAKELGLDEHSSPADLVAQNLMHIDPAARPNMTWAEWFVEAGEVAELPEPRLVYNSYPTVIQEAIAGNGIALGWQHLLSNMMGRGLLLPVGPIVQRPQGGHHVCWHAGRSDHRHMAIRECLEAEIQTSSAWFVRPS